MIVDTNKFTVKDAIKIQAEQLKGWKKVLKPEKYLVLQAWCIVTNQGQTRADSIKRGTDLDNYIHNILILENGYEG
jgi:hypothetical protein